MASFYAVYTGHFDLKQTFGNNLGIFKTLAVNSRQVVSW